jgi:Tfp pilus assembly protein PilF
MMKKIILGIIIILSLIAAVIYSVYMVRINQQKNVAVNREIYLQYFKAGQDLFSVGKFSEAATSFEKSLNANNDKKQNGQAVLDLAKSYFFSQQPEKAVNILKKMSTDQDYPSYYQANALVVLAGFYYFKVEDDNFFRTNVFTGDLEKILVESNNSLSLAINNLLEKSISIYPSIRAYYWSGVWYSEKAIINTDANIKVGYLQKARDCLSHGDYILASDTQNNLLGNSAPVYYYLRARLLARLFTLGGLGSKAEVDEAFSKALDLHGKDARVFTQYNTDFWLRFYWAAFVAEFDGANGQDKIKELITPIINDYASGNPVQANFFQALENLNKDENVNTYSHRKALLVAKYSPEFKEILVKLGWSEEELGRAITSLGEVK